MLDTSSACAEPSSPARGWKPPATAGGLEEGGVLCAQCLQDSRSGEVLGEPAGPSRSPRHAESPPLLVGLGLLKWVGAGAGPYGLMCREDLALLIKQGLVQELLLALPPRASPALQSRWSIPLFQPDGLQKAPKCACN